MPANNASPTAIPAVNVAQPEQRGLDQRCPARPAAPHLVRGEQRRAAATPAASMPNVQAGQPSSRPSTSGNTSSARPVDTSTIPTGSGRGPSRGARLRQHRRGQGQRGEPERHVDQEDRAPAQARHVPGDERAPEDRRPDHGEADRRAERAERLAEVVGRECGLEDAEALRDQHRAEQALCDAEADQHARRGREPAQRRRGDEPDEPDEEHAPSSVQVAEAAAGDQPGREGERVARGHPLDHRVAAAQLRADRGGRDAHDRAVHQVHDLRRQHGDQGEPAPSIGGHERVRS